MKLTNRLMTVASLVNYKRIADVGTDHGKIPIFLLKEKKVDFAVASDINEGPLKACRRNAEKNNLIDLIDIRHFPGISGIKAGEVDTVIIAGMGGELISNILSDNMNVAKSIKELILQPMTGEEYLREFLYNNGFSICNEVLADENEKIYVVIRAVPKQETDKENIYFPEKLLKNDKYKVDMYYKKISKRIEDKIFGAKAEQNTDKFNEQINIKEMVNKIYETL